MGAQKAASWTVYVRSTFAQSREYDVLKDNSHAAMHFDAADTTTLEPPYYRRLLVGSLCWLRQYMLCGGLEPTKRYDWYFGGQSSAGVLTYNSQGCRSRNHASKPCMRVLLGIQSTKVYRPESKRHRHSLERE